RIRLSFDSFVTVGSGAVSVARNSGLFNATGGTYNGAVTTARVGPVVFNPASTTMAFFSYDFGFSGSGVEVSGSLVDGAYALTINGSAITTPGGQLNGGGATSQNFHRLFGDVNGDMHVDGTDQTAFNAAFGSIAGQANYRDYFDFDNNGTVDASDQNQFNSRFGLY